MLINSGTAPEHCGLERPWKTLLSLSQSTYWNHFPLQCNIHRSPAPHPAHRMKAEDKNCQRVQGRECWSHVGCCPAWEPGLTEWRGWVLTQALLPPMKQVLDTLTDAFTLLLWGELGWLGALAPCLCWAARLQCSSALTWGSGGDFLHTNPSQTRKSLVLVLCLCYYKLPVWQLEQKILLVLLKQ